MCLQSKVSELEREVGWLKDQLGKAKGVNDLIWENVVQRVMNGKPTGGEAGEMDVDLEDRRKRSRN